jgi:NADH dehydrogenase [ubiquinone] 1 alpha subcomplex assembly factor 7
MKTLIAVAVALAFGTAAYAQDKKAAEPAKPSTMEKVKEAGAKNTAATNEAKAKKKADADARAAAQKEARDKKAAERKAKKEAKAKAKMDAKK